MKSSLSVLVTLALLATAGCRTDPAIPILERELRRKEDEIYRLRATLEEFQDCGSSCQEVVVDGSRSTAPAESNAAGSRRRAGSSAPNGANPPQIELPSQPASKVPESLKGAAPAGASPPDVPEHLRGPSKPLVPKDAKPGNHTRSLDPADPDGPVLEKGVTSRSGRIMMASRSTSGEPLAPSGDSRKVASIVLNRDLTGGIAHEDRPGDQGLLVVFEPRDRAGRAVDAPAEVNVVVMDPALSGDASRVARWDFTAAEVAAMFRRTGFSQAIHLTAAWPGDPPTHRKLHLYVRYITADGRKLVADQPIEIALPGDRMARRTSAESDWPPASSTPPAGSRPKDSKPQRPSWSPERQ